MRVNVYTEELTDRIEVVRADKDGKEYVGVRFYLELPVTMASSVQVRGKFLGPGDCTAAVTFWMTGDPREFMRKALAAVMAQVDGVERALGSVLPSRRLVPELIERLEAHRMPANFERRFHELAEARRHKDVGDDALVKLVWESFKAYADQDAAE